MTNPENTHYFPLPPLFLDFEESACITPDGKEHPLTPMEINLLARLHDRFQTTHDLATQLTRQCCTEQPETGRKRKPVSDNFVQVLVNSIRGKIGHEYIESRPGYGYRILNPAP